MVQMELMGQSYSLMNGGPHYRLSPAVSIEIHLETQAEVDTLWDTLVQGGAAMRCGWLTDRFGLSWQIIPCTLMRLMSGPDPEAIGRVMQAMMGMVKLDGPALEAAARG